MIGERLLNLRRDAGLTQDELGLILRINKHSISSYERDKSDPPDDLKVRIAQYFGVSVDYLLGLTDQPVPPEGGSHAFRLPARFPQQGLAELQGFVDYLMFKYREEP